MAMLTVMGLYEYDNTIFNNMYLPTGVDRTTMINHIILETAEMETIYPVPNFLKSAINLWSASRAMTWDKIYQASQLEYNPIENYDRQETESTTASSAHSGKDTTITSGTATSNGTNKIAGFDSSVLVDHDSSEGTATDSGSHELTHGEQIADQSSRTSRIHGNIGVTTSQQMLEQELQIAGKLNIYDYIAQEFKSRFCILVY